MVSMISKYIFLFFVVLGSTVSAQLKITGKILTPGNTPIEFAEIVLLTLDSVAIKSEFTDEKGAFIVEAPQGIYRLVIRQWSKVFLAKVVELKADIDIGTIMTDNVNQLESVTIVGAKKKLVERKVDRLIFNVENSINASGGDALEALKITPGIKVQNDKISMIGKSNLSVMIDDKIVQLSGEELANYLKSLPADAVKSIEVITTPPAKYEAAGNSGLVNIKLKKAQVNSWSTLIGGSYLQRKQYGEEAFTGTFNYNKNKLGISSSLNYRNGAKTVDQDDYAYFTDALWYTNSPFKRKNERLNGQIALDYRITPKWTIGTQFFLNDNKETTNDMPYLGVFDYNTELEMRHLKSDGLIKQNPNIKSLNLFNEFKIDTLGRKIIVNLDYFNFKNNDDRIYNGQSIIQSPYSLMYYGGENINNQNITNISGKIDVDLPTKWVIINVGGKISNSISVNRISFFNSGFVSVPATEMPLAQSNFKYTENVQALYVSANKKINKHWESQLGLRMESTQTITVSENIDGVKKDYIKPFPTSYLSYIPNDNSTFTLSYSRRIERPKFDDLNPNINFINPFQTIIGNPFLQPAFIDNIEFTYSYKKLENKLYVSHEENLFSQVPIADPNTNIINFTNRNYINANAYGISENYVFDKFKFWTSNNSIDVNYTVSKSTLAIAQGNSGFNSRISTSNDFVLR